MTGDHQPSDVDHVHPAEDTTHEGCVLCGSNRPFDLPDPLLRAAREGRLLVFAGAGTSTEVPAVFPTSLYSDIRAETGKDAHESFPEVMNIYEQLHGRAELVRRIKSRLDYVDSFPSLRFFATRFHKELSTMPYISNVITTNWDRYFEEECGAIPIVTDQDYAFYKLPGRKVYKIHGSIEAVSSIVATTQDYHRVLEALRLSALGGTLRHLLATNVVVFIGYSLTDPDFRAIYLALTESMRPMRPEAYAVSPVPPANIEELNLRIIETDGTFFLHQLKSAVVSTCCYLDDKVFERLEPFGARLTNAHLEVTRELPPEKYPGVVYCLSYQDGVEDALSRIWARKKTGEYSDEHRVLSALHTYEKALDIALQRERFWDAAYIEGYWSGLSLLVVEEEAIGRLPLHYCFTNADLRDMTDLRRAVRGLPRRKDKRLWNEAKRIMDQVGPNMIPQHTPFLDGVMQYLDQPVVEETERRGRS